MKMIKKLSILPMLIGLMLAPLASFAVTAINAGVSIPAQNPIYEPNSVITLPAASLATGGYLNIGAQNIFIPTVGNDVFVFKFAGGSTACAGLNATVLVSLDNGATYTQINVYPYPALGTATPTILASGGPVLYSTGMSKVNIEGYTNIEISISALTGATCVLSASMGNGDFNSVAF